MPEPIDLWIQSSIIDDTGALHIDATRLSTFQQLQIKYSVDERSHISPLWSGIGVHYVEHLPGKVIEFTPQKHLYIPTRLIGDTYTGIIPDVHEPDQVIEGLNGVVRTALYAGDYFWVTKHGKKVLVERKRLENGELLGTLYSPRQHKKGLEAALTAQARKMSEFADHRILLIEMGYYRVDAWSGNIDLPLSKRIDKKTGERTTLWPYKWADVQKALLSLYDRWGIYPWLTYNKDHTSDDLWALRGYLDKATHSSQRSLVEHEPSIAQAINYDPSVQMLCFVGGIGPTIATRALAHFGSVKAAVNGTVDDWMQIDGVGKKIANKFVDAVSRSIKQ